MQRYYTYDSGVPDNLKNEFRLWLKNEPKERRDRKIFKLILLIVSVIAIGALIAFAITMALRQIFDLITLLLLVCLIVFSSAIIILGAGYTMFAKKQLNRFYKWYKAEVKRRKTESSVSGRHTEYNPNDLSYYK